VYAAYLDSSFVHKKLFLLATGNSRIDRAQKAKAIIRIK